MSTLSCMAVAACLLLQVTLTGAFSSINYAGLPRPELQALAKERGIKANLASAEIIKQLQAQSDSAPKNAARVSSPSPPAPTTQKKATPVAPVQKTLTQSASKATIKAADGKSDKDLDIERLMNEQGLRVNDLLKLRSEITAEAERAPKAPKAAKESASSSSSSVKRPLLLKKKPANAATSFGGAPRGADSPDTRVFIRPPTPTSIAALKPSPPARAAAPAPAAAPAAVVSKPAAKVKAAPAAPAAPKVQAPVQVVQGPSAAEIAAAEAAALQAYALKQAAQRNQQNKAAEERRARAAQAVMAAAAAAAPLLAAAALRDAAAAKAAAEEREKAQAAAAAVAAAVPRFVGWTPNVVVKGSALRPAEQSGGSSASKGQSEVTVVPAANNMAMLQVAVTALDTLEAVSSAVVGAATVVAMTSGPVAEKKVTGWTPGAMVVGSALPKSVYSAASVSAPTPVAVAVALTSTATPAVGGSYNNGSLDGVTLETILERLVAKIGYEGMFEATKIKAFYNKPSITSSLKALRHLEMAWARELVEKLYVRTFRRQ